MLEVPVSQQEHGTVREHPFDTLTQVRQLLSRFAVKEIGFIKEEKDTLSL